MWVRLIFVLAFVIAVCAILLIFQSQITHQVHEAQAGFEAGLKAAKAASK
jgi:hypothetical protein